MPAELAGQFTMSHAEAATRDQRINSTDRHALNLALEHIIGPPAGVPRVELITFADGQRVLSDATPDGGAVPGQAPNPSASGGIA